MRRTAFLIDGFNLYHSVKQASKHLCLNGAGTRWLDIRALCSSYLSALGREYRLSEVYYFSALAKHLEATKPEVTLRHQKFIKCLKSTGIQVELGRFKQKDILCPYCNKRLLRHEEKETDVAISIKLLELLLLDLCDVAVLVTGDTDISPAVRTARRLCPTKEICFLFPYLRKNKELEKLARTCFTIKAGRYTQFQFPDHVILHDGTMIHKPGKW